ncbi:hypothetical protein FP744_10003573 [Trichoderma asperellum]|nr:hypothetical protein LI328DRAFT_146102 [Trichoderma asperelloides]
MPSNIRILTWSSLFSLALAQTATIQFFEQDTACASGLFAECTDLPPGDCCFIQGLATCASFQTNNGVDGLAAIFVTSNQNACGIVLELLESGVCACPNGAPIISAGNWQLVGGVVNENNACNPVSPDVLGWKENGATWVLHQKDNTAVFDQVTEAIGHKSADQDKIGNLIKEHGVEI